MTLKEKVEGTIDEVKRGLKPEEKKDQFVTFCVFTGKHCKVICGVGTIKEARAVTEESIPCTWKEYESFAKSCELDSKWSVDKLPLTWRGAYCYYSEKQ